MEQKETFDSATFVSMLGCIVPQPVRAVLALTAHLCPRDQGNPAYLPVITTNQTAWESQ